MKIALMFFGLFVVVAFIFYGHAIVHNLLFQIAVITFFSSFITSTVVAYWIFRR